MKCRGSRGSRGPVISGEIDFAKWDIPLKIRTPTNPFFPNMYVDGVNVGGPGWTP